MAKTNNASASKSGAKRRNSKNSVRASVKADSTKPAETAASTGTVALDRRAAGDRRKTDDRRKRCQPVATERRVIQRRAKVSRRRQIDPTTCERDYSDREIEFMSALEAYKRTSGRMFPTCSEILEVLIGLGYENARPSRSPSRSPVRSSLPIRMKPILQGGSESRTCVPNGV